MHDDQAAVLAALASPGAYPHATDAIRIIETHISTVFLTGPFAYKVKKAVTFPFLDFSTLPLRERACQDELRLNRRLAPALYREVVGIGGPPGEIRVGGEPVVEFAVKMTQFPAGATAHELILDDALKAAELESLADRIGQFHESLPPASGGEPAASILANLAELEAEAGEAMRGDLEDVAASLRASLDGLSASLAQRAEAGCVRECHGDLHLGNLVRFDGELIPFDCLEFSLPMRTIDVIDEAAFLFMDLVAHERRDLAYAFLNTYLGVTGDFAGLTLLRLYVAHRALVRAKVAIASPRQLPVPHTEQHAARYLETALAQAHAPRPLCVITTGLSGSGKTTIARQLALGLGAVHVRSDVERKRLHGFKPDERSGSMLDRGIYDAESTAATYARLADAARAALSGRVSVIADAAFLRREQRDRIRSTLASLDADCVILECTAPSEVLRERIVARHEAGSDASEADLGVLAQQLATAEPLTDDEQSAALTLDTEHAIDANDLAQQIRERTVQPSVSSTSY